MKSQYIAPSRKACVKRRFIVFYKVDMKLKQIAFKYSLLLPFFVLASLLASLWSVTAFAAECGGTDTAIISCGGVGFQPSGDPNAPSRDSDGIAGLLFLTLQILTAGVGIVAVGGLIYGGILYTSAGDSPEKVKKAIEVIRNVIIGIIAYFLMAALLNFLIPGGILL